MSDAPSTSTPHDKHHNKLLVLIAIFKLIQAALFIAIGIGALHLINVDIDDLLTKVLGILRFNPESHIVNLILIKASILDAHMLRRISAVVFIYAGLGLIEGIGLYLEKTWAEYFTLILTGSFLPLEVFEIVRRLTWTRAGLFVLNALVFFYLLKLVIERGKKPGAGSAV